MPKIVFLWTDLVLWAMVLALAVYGWRIARSPNLRATWMKVLRDPIGLCAGIVLAVFALVTLADSLHFRRALPPAAGSPADAPIYYATSTESVLDLLLARPIADAREQLLRAAGHHRLQQGGGGAGRCHRARQAAAPTRRRPPAGPGEGLVA